MPKSDSGNPYEFARQKPVAPPKLHATCAMEIAGIVADLRRGLKIRQADLARRAGVSRQWIVAMEQGKPSLEVGLVLRTLETLGLECVLSPVDPPPPWITRSLRDAQQKRYELQARRRARRKTRREAARLYRLSQNIPKVRGDVE